jgi:bifunctional DNA-binding transcriptional regulator/antitoxin component of YhaV-PrlF toxin-antitoxin module
MRKVKSPFNEEEATARLDPGGRMAIPQKFLKKLRLKAGDEVRMTFDADGLHVWSATGKLRRIQTFARTRVPTGALVSEELIEDRKREAELE